MDIGGEVGVRLRVTCGKLTLSPSQCQSEELSEIPRDLELLEEGFNKETGGHGTFVRLKDRKETLKDEESEENVVEYQHQSWNIFIQIVFFAILAYFILEQVLWFIQWSKFPDEPAEKMGMSEVSEGFVQLSRLSNIPLRQ